MDPLEIAVHWEHSREADTTQAVWPPGFFFYRHCAFEGVRINPRNGKFTPNYGSKLELAPSSWINAQPVADYSTSI